jgi:hypothetical protein
MGAIETARELNQRWMQKADESVDSFDAYIFYWIAFNIFYSRRTDEMRDSVAVEMLGKDEELNGRFETFVRINRASFNLLKELHPPVQDTRHGSVVVVENDTLTEVLGVLYQVRCNLFHGDKGDSVKRDREVIESTLPMLREIVRDFSTLL